MEIGCGKCKQRLKISEANFGQTVRCPKCQETLQIGIPTGKTTASATGSSLNKPKPKAATANRKINCPTCRKPMAIPANSSATAFRCASCKQIVRLGAPKPATNAKQQAASNRVTPVQAAPVPVTPIAAPTDLYTQANQFDSLASLGSLPSNASGSSHASYGATTNPIPANFSTPGSASSANAGSTFGPGVMLSIVTGIGLAGSLLGLVLYVVGSMQGPRTNEVPMYIMAGLALLAVFYNALVLAGSIAMIRQRTPLFGKISCALAILPFNFLAHGLCLGVITYPLAIGAGVWGLVILFSKPASNSYANTGANIAAAPQSQVTNPYQSAVAGGPAIQTSSRDDSGTGSAWLQILIGFGFLGLAGGLAYLAYSDFDNVRRPGKAIGGVICLTIAGCTSLIKGLIGLTR